MFSISSSNCCCVRSLVPCRYLLARTHKPPRQLILTLKARCSRKWAVPLVLSVSALDPASIQTPTVEVCAHGECSVAICTLNQSAVSSIDNSRIRTVKPLESVVLSVLMPWVMGVARPLRKGRIEFRAARLRRCCFRLRANRREAMAAIGRGNGREIVVVSSRVKDKYRYSVKLELRLSNPSGQSEASASVQ